MKLRNYETIFVLTPVLTSEQIESTIIKFRNLLLEKGAEIVHEEAIGLKKLAYPIQHKNTGIYHLIEFKARPDLINALEVGYKRDETIIRFLTFVLDKHGIEYNQKKRNGTLQLHSKVEAETEFKKEIVA
ncbi:MAG: 30S ribosomal protein S6 [Candidatus Amoebophilus sp. 36-38]|nr:MAG: 30S ribosomal protein S6 [Candidatus Amoebophilus sp. 36-38]